MSIVMNSQHARPTLEAVAGSNLERLEDILCGSWVINLTESPLIHGV